MSSRTPNPSRFLLPRDRESRMGLFAHTVAGGGFILIGAYESLTFSASKHPIPPPLSDLTKQPSTSRARKNPSFSSLSSIPISIFSFLFIINALVSFFDALNSNDRVGSALQLQVIAISFLFLLYSILGLLPNFTDSIRFPSQILNLIALFAFVEEFLLFYLQRKDTSGIENRYFDLLLVPITICVFSTVLELKSPKSSFAKLGRGVGLILQGTWFGQMGISFFTNLIVHGCSLHEKSRGNYTVRCKGHPEYHRGRAIATLQFNCHLAFLVALIVGVYAIIVKKNGNRSDLMQYRPLGGEMQQLDSQAHFTLDSDEDDEIKEEENVEKQKGGAVELSVNGFSSHQ